MAMILYVNGVDTYTNYLDLPELSPAPSNPPADHGRLYVADDGGNTRLYFRDNAGNVTDILTDAIGANAALSNLAATAVNADIKPGADEGANLGDPTHKFGRIFLGAGSAGVAPVFFGSMGIYQYNATALGLTDGASSMLIQKNGITGIAPFTISGNGGYIALRSGEVDSAVSHGCRICFQTAQTTPGAKIAEFYSDSLSTLRASIDYLGKYTGSAVRVDAGSAAAPSVAVGLDNSGFFYSGGKIGTSIGGVVGIYIIGKQLRAVEEIWGNSAWVSVLGYDADAADSVGVKIGNLNALTTPGAKIVSFCSDDGTTERACVDYLGKYTGSAVEVAAGTLATPSVKIGTLGVYEYGGGYIGVSKGSGTPILFGTNSNTIENVSYVMATAGASATILGRVVSGIAFLVANTSALAEGDKIAAFYNDNRTTMRAYIGGRGKVAAFGGLSAESSTGGGEVRKYSEATVTLSGASGTCQVNIPAGAIITGVQFRVDTAVTSGDGATSWDAVFSGGSSLPLFSAQAFAQNTKGSLKSLYVEDVGSEVDIDITPDSGTFSGGVIRFIVYYTEITALDDV